MFIILWFVYLFLDFFNLIGISLFARKVTRITPNEIQNSLYSLSSSISTFFALILILDINFICNAYSMTFAIVILIVVKIIALLVMKIEKEYNSKLHQPSTT